MRPRGITRGNSLARAGGTRRTPSGFNEAAGYYPRKPGVDLPHERVIEPLQ